MAWVVKVHPQALRRTNDFKKQPGGKVRGNEPRKAKSVNVCEESLVSKTSAMSLTLSFVSSTRRSASAIFNHHSKLARGKAKSATPVRWKTFSTMSPESECYTVAITGASGLLGTAIIDELSKKTDGKLNGKEVRVIKLYRSENVEKEEQAEGQVIVSQPWNPKADSENAVAIDKELLDSIDAVVHLAGENVGTGLLPGPLGMLGVRAWSDEKKDLITNSRVGPTKALATAISKSARPTSFIVASGVGVYGYDFMAEEGEDQASPDESFDVSRTTGFLANLSREWELASQPAAIEENRVVNLRLAPIMSKLGGALEKLYPIFFLGGGGNVGKTFYMGEFTLNLR